MANNNAITVTGNVTRDPELRYTAGGQAKATIGLAVNRRWQNRQTSEWEEAVSFFNIIAWGELAEHVSDSVAKGTRIIVTGRLDQRSWETQEGEKRTVVEIVADEIGPSLRYATAEVTKAERREGGDYGGGRGGGSGGSGSGGGGGRAPRSDEPPAAAGGYDDDEEPF